MVGSGLVGSLAHPGGNTTGVSMLAGDLDGKRQEILIEVVHGLRRMAALADFNTTASPQLQALEDAARTRGVELSIYRITKPDEIPAAIDAAKTSDAEALNVLESASLGLATNYHGTRSRSTTAGYCQWPDAAEQGGFVAYGPRLIEVYRDLMAWQLASFCAVSNRPIYLSLQPTKFDLAINMKLRALGFCAIPESFFGPRRPGDRVRPLTSGNGLSVISRQRRTSCCFRRIVLQNSFWGCVKNFRFMP